MKHPHCNRSRAAHLFWCRGFAPVVFIFAIALIVVAIGSGIYFTINSNTAQAPGPQEMITAAPTSEVDASSTAVVVFPIAAVAAKPVAVSLTNCGSNSKAASQCLAEHIQSCSPARGSVIDPDSGLTVERIIDGYKGDKCSYRTNIVSGKGDFALLAGMDINCMLPKATLATMQSGSMSQEDLVAYCTGSFMDLMREQIGASVQ